MSPSKGPCYANTHCCGSCANMLRCVNLLFLLWTALFPLFGLQVIDIDYEVVLALPQDLKGKICSCSWHLPPDWCCRTGQSYSGLWWKKIGFFRPQDLISLEILLAKKPYPLLYFSNLLNATDRVAAIFLIFLLLSNKPPFWEAGQNAPTFLWRSSVNDLTAAADSWISSHI